MNLTNAQIREAMAMTALDIGEPGRDFACGYGLVQAYDALQYLEETKPGKGPNKQIVPWQAIRQSGTVEQKPGCRDLQSGFYLSIMPA